MGWYQNIVASHTVREWMRQDGKRAERAFADCAFHHERGLPLRVSLGERVASHHQVFGLGRLVFTSTCVEAGVLSTSVVLFQER